MKYLDTQIRLPPDRPSGEIVKEFLELVLRRFRWFEPRRYGSASLANAIEPDHFDLAPLVAHYEEHNSLCVATRTERDFIWFSPILPGSPPYTGQISWTTSASSASKASWRTAYVHQIPELMRLVGSPLAQAGLETDLDRKQRRRVSKSIPSEGGVFTYSQDELTVRHYGQGLAGLFWRNFYGPPFVRMFGERLEALPPECLHPLGEDLVLVQPYELPTEAGSPAATAREHQLISLLGPECFYDHAHHTLPTPRPVRDALGQPLH
jgi:hypothetical protein